MTTTTTTTTTTARTTGPDVTVLAKHDDLVQLGPNLWVRLRPEAK